MDQIGAAPVKKRFHWKILVAVVAALALVAGLAWAVLSLGNSKSAPVSAAEKYRNAKETSLEDYIRDSLARSDGGKASRLIKLMRKSSLLSDTLTEWEDSFAEDYQNNADEYGSNFKIRYKINRTFEEALEKEELREYRNGIKDLGEDFYELGKKLGKLKSSDLRDLADDLDMDPSDLKALISATKELGQAFKGAEVSEGFLLDVEVRITGSELDGPESDDMDFVVLKVNGKWVSSVIFDSLRYLYRNLFSISYRYL